MFLKERGTCWKGYVLCNSSYVALWKRQDYGDGKQISGCLGLRGGRNEEEESRALLGVNLFIRLYKEQVDTCCYASVKVVMVRCQYRFISYSKYIE